jgi:hypothetical protein
LLNAIVLFAVSAKILAGLRKLEGGASGEEGGSEAGYEFSHGVVVAEGAKIEKPRCAVEREHFGFQVRPFSEAKGPGPEGRYASMTKIAFIAALALSLLTQAPNAAAAPKKAAEDVFATCANKEASFEFHAGADGKVSYVLVNEFKYPVERIECNVGSRKGEQAVCNDEHESNELVLYTGGYAIMHYNTDNDSNYDGRKAQCK